MPCLKKYKSFGIIETKNLYMPPFSSSLDLINYYELLQTTHKLFIEAIKSINLEVPQRMPQKFL